MLIKQWCSEKKGMFCMTVCGLFLKARFSVSVLINVEMTQKQFEMKTKTKN